MSSLPLLYSLLQHYYLNTDNGGTYPWYTVGLCSHVSTISWLASPVSLCYAPPSTVCGLTWSHSSPQSSSQPHWDSCRVHFWRDTSSYALSTTPELSSPSASSPIVFVAPHRPPSSRGTSSTSASSSQTLFCNYCRKRGYMIADCRILQQHYDSNKSNRSSVVTASVNHSDPILLLPISVLQTS